MKKIEEGEEVILKCTKNILIRNPETKEGSINNVEDQYKSSYLLMSFSSLPEGITTSSLMHAEFRIIIKEFKFLTTRPSPFLHVYNVLSSLESEKRPLIDASSQCSIQLTEQFALYRLDITDILRYWLLAKNSYGLLMTCSYGTFVLPALEEYGLVPTIALITKANKEDILVDINLIINSFSPSYASLPIVRAAGPDNISSMVWSFYLFGSDSDGLTRRLGIYLHTKDNTVLLHQTSPLDTKTEYNIKWLFIANKESILEINGNLINSTKACPVPKYESTKNIMTGTAWYYNSGGRTHTAFDGIIKVNKISEKF